MHTSSPIASDTWPALPDLPEGEWPAQGQWTYKDYLRLPEVPRRRFEVLFGVLWTTRAPTVSHETVVHRIAYELQQHLEPLPGSILLSAPAEVVVPFVVEPAKPDILTVSAGRAGIVAGQVVQGPPDLVVEVLARRTGRLDRRMKFAAYEQAGVPEYWMAAPRARTLQVYVLDGGYSLLGEYGPGDVLASRILPGLRIPTNRVFGR